MSKITVISFILSFIFLFSTGQDLFPSNNSKKQSQDKLIVYYFYFNPRCMTCNKIEKQTKETLDKYYKDYLDKKSIIFKSIDYKKKENNHYESKYNLYTKSVVLSKVIKGKELKHKILPRVWELVHRPEAFYSYVKSNIDEFLK